MGLEAPNTPPSFQNIFSNNKAFSAIITGLFCENNGYITVSNISRNLKPLKSDDAI